MRLVADFKMANKNKMEKKVYIQTEEHKNNMSISQQKRKKENSKIVKQLWTTSAYRKKTTEAHIGKEVSEKTRKLISEARKGHSVSKKTRQKLRNAMYKRIEKLGYMNTPETRAKISKTLTGRHPTIETRKKLKKSLHKRIKRDGYNLSPEALKQMVNTRKKRGNYRQSKESIKKIKEARAKQITPVKDTSIEVKIQNFLKQLQIPFFTHQYMKIEHGYQCDILIPSMNLVIECDGDYWHKYPVGLEKDHIRTKELIEKGFKVLRLWEFEINAMTIKHFENKLADSIKD